MPPDFFPGVSFAWLFYLLLVGVTLAASYTDLRQTTVPKWLTLPALALGFAMNVSRTALLEKGGWQGAETGFLFALQGFGLAFGLFFALFALGTCRGGDVKLVAALGAWLGPGLIFLAVAGTILLVAVVTGTRWVRGAGKSRGSLVYSPALALSVALLVFLRYHVE